MITLSSNLKARWPYILLLPLTILSPLSSVTGYASPQTFSTCCSHNLKHCALTLHVATSNWSSVTSCSKKLLGLFHFWLWTLSLGSHSTLYLPLSRFYVYLLIIPLNQEFLEDWGVSCVYVPGSPKLPGS